MNSMILHSDNPVHFSRLHYTMLSHLPSFPSGLSSYRIDNALLSHWYFESRSDSLISPYFWLARNSVEKWKILLVLSSYHLTSNVSFQRLHPSAYSTIKITRNFNSLLFLFNSDEKLFSNCIDIQLVYHDSSTNSSLIICVQFLFLNTKEILQVPTSSQQLNFQWLFIFRQLSITKSEILTVRFQSHRLPLSYIVKKNYIVNA